MTAERKLERAKARFFKGFTVDDKGSCWLWNRSKDSCGYGTIRVCEKNKKASRFSWEIKNGRNIPVGLEILHSCDTPACVNPDHLRLGTHKENMEDMVRRGRRADTSGENNPNAKRSADVVVAIRRDFADGLRQHKIVSKYGLTKCAVSEIVNRKTWAVLP